MLKPENIHCLALNYKGVGLNAESPLYFVKSKNSICFDGMTVSYPNGCESMWTEVELGIVIAESCSQVDETEASKYIEGFIVCGDITCENINKRDHHLAFSKSRKNFCPVSKRLVLLDESELTDLKMTTHINGRLTQEGNISDIIFDAYKSLSYISHITELCKGDIILTGTPAGVENNIIRNGDRVTHSIEKVGQVSFKVGR